ncbi:MAG: tetratricopeptide repeat protein [Bacteroidota bacterium]|nr:tetratricopeptide repeat protein [Bacteroidota bacterium]
MQFSANAQINLQAGGNNSKEALAIQFFEQKEYEKANVYLEDLFEKNPNVWFGYYYKSLLMVKDVDKAEKITKKHIKNNKNDASFLVLLGNIYNITGDKKKEDECYQKALKELNAVQPFINNLAQAFVDAKLYDNAIAVYNKGKKATPDYPYFYERADVYKLKGDVVAMVNEYLDAIDFRDSELYMAQNNLQNSLGYDEESAGLKNPILKQELQKRIQSKPDKIVFAEFLIFILKQQKEFDAAFIQSKSIDKRNKEDGRRVYELARICVSNKAWETGQRCYQYLIDKPNCMYSESSAIEILGVEYELVLEKPQATNEELIAVEQKLQAASDKHKGTFMQTFVVKNLAILKAYYLSKPEEAISLLDEVVANPSIKPVDKADYKILQADIFLISGAIWDASLLYSQVEKDFKYEAIGHEAKFKNAKLSFYAGDFKWAKTQCDVLKGATTKLIANDALDLSLIITDAIGVDTNEVPLQLFASAELMILQHRYTDAIARMDSVNLLFSNNTLGDDIFYKKAAIYERTNKYTDAEKMYKDIVEFYPSELYGDDAQYKLAQLYEYKIKDNTKAKEAYEAIITNYPGSIFVTEARKRFRELRGDKINN